MGGGGRGVNRNLVPTAGPLLGNLARLCENPINPSRYIAVQVLFNWRFNNNDDDNAVNNGDELQGWRFYPRIICTGRQIILDGKILPSSCNNRIGGGRVEYWLRRHRRHLSIRRRKEDREEVDEEKEVDMYEEDDDKY